MSILVWRIWRSTTLELHGFYGVLWEPHEIKKAKCDVFTFVVGLPVFGGVHVDGDDTAPGVGCRCGIYGLKRAHLSKLYEDTDDYYTRDEVLGIAEIWGKVITAEFGYRAQYARLHALVNAPASIVERYGVPNLPSAEYAHQEWF